MPNRYWDASIIFTRVGLSADTLLEVGEKYNVGFNRAQFAEVTKLKITSLRDKLRDLRLYGFIKQTGVDYYIITEEGKSIIAGGPQRAIAIEAAVNRSLLWKQLLSTIGKTPDRVSFDRAVKSVPELSDIDTNSLDNLWFAFNADVACINKNPPFSSRQTSIHKLTLHMPGTYVVEPSHVITPPPDTQNTPRLEPITTVQGNENKITIPPTPREDERAPEPGKVEYRGHAVVVTDDLTAKFAESLVKKMIKDLKRKGVEFDE